MCELVPDVECVNVLKRVPELQCTPEIFEDCNDVEKKVPYLVPEEDCVEVTFDECQEVKKVSWSMFSMKTRHRFNPYINWEITAQSGAACRDNAPL